MKKLLLLLTFLSFVSVSSFADAGTDWRNNQLHQLEKITVGPWDNFGTTLSEKNDEIIYTRDKNQILSLVKHNIKTGESENLTFADGDIKQPTFNQKKNTLAFTYFGNDAQGDVCIFRFEKDVVECLSSNSGVEQSPFWLSDTKVGYLKRKPDSFLWQLVIHDLITSQSKVIAEGNISAPTSSNDGEYVLFNDKTGGEQILRLYQVSTGTETIMPDVDLPGDIGFTAFSTKDEYVYFSYYLNDTNADQAINADDNSVVFRMPFQKWKNYRLKKSIPPEAASGIYPEQLTSVDFNCKFPNPGLLHLYLTCAFEGSLDVYRLPLSGMVASHWQKKELDEAHLVARSYEQRLLLLNAKRYRSQSVSVDLLQRFIGNHIQIGEITAARYYISQLLSYYKKQGEIDKTAQIFYYALDSLLFLRSEKHKYKNDIVTIPFQRLTQTIRKKMSDISGVSKQAIAIKMLAFAFIESELGNDELALKHLESVNLSQFPLEIQKYLYISLFEQAGSGSAYSAQLLRLYPVLFNDMDMSYSFRLFYAFKYLSIEKGDSLVGSGYLIDDVKDDQLKPLFIVDEKSRAIVSAKEDKEKVGVYKSLSKIIKENDDNVLLRKAMHVRAIQIFLENDEYEYMELLSRHWLTVSRVSEMEFVNVATQYAKVSMDKAYGFINQNEPVRAFNTFYPVIRQTNDLEAYYQYLTIGLDKRTKQKDKLEKNLETLKKKKMLGEQEKYVDALRLLIESVDSESKSAKPNNKVLDEALAKLQSINSNEPGSAMQELLLGYIYHRKMQVTQSGYVYDKRLYQNAHYHYLMAIDFAQENARISATVWQNLGWL
ncbi:MAG: hypothetical protein OEX07_08610, partial [Gammaproteobacteria bacterium]|nr:hypothetical protein [Gammaproteobacteria bacterium]